MKAINLQKSEIFCSKNIFHTAHNAIANILGVQVVLGPGKYLEFHSMTGRSKKTTFSYSKDRGCKITNSWSSKCLSKAGHGVLIKSILQSFPTYFTSLFMLLSIIPFWSGRSGSQNEGILMLSWNKLSMHKQDKGINLVLLGGAYVIPSLFLELVEDGELVTVMIFPF
jgi:hypothetical protein